MVNIKSKCKRCGKCCQRIWIPVSPESLFRVHRWLDCGGEGYSFYSDLYGMWEYSGESKETDNNGESQIRYMYHCKNLKVDIKDNYYCAIHDSKPPICRNFPEYKNAISKDKVYLWDGCGYQNSLEDIKDC